MMDMASKLESRADYIKQLTQSLANAGKDKAAGGPSTSATPPAEAVAAVDLELEMNDNISVGGETVTSVLYKYGREASQDRKANVRKSGSSIPAIGNQEHHQFRSASAQSVDSFEHSHLSEARESSTVPYMDEAHLQFLINKEQNKMNKSQKLVSGSQFRNTTKVNFMSCEQCIILDRVGKKYKETIRSLRLQIARLEEQNHDLKRFKNGESIHQLMSKSAALASSTSAVTTAIVTASQQADQEENMEDIQFLAGKCEQYESDIAKVKKLLLYERNLNEGLRKTLDETRTALKEEVAGLQKENISLQEELQREKEKRGALQSSYDETTTTLLRYKQQLERTENKLSDTVV
jgi:hypothetical protein